MASAVPAIKTHVDLASVADFFRKGSDANFAAFQSNVVKELGNQAGLSEDDTMARFADLDIDVALSVNQRNVLEGLKAYIGEGEPNAEYAQLGFAISNYTRNALLVEKYYSNGQLDANFQLAGVRSEVALSAGLDLGKRQLAASVGRPAGPGHRARPPGGLRTSWPTPSASSASTTSSTPCPATGAGSCRPGCSPTSAASPPTG